MSKQPLVSIVTPTYNCGRYLEETLLSVRDQDYPNIEHIVVDGASEDNTTDTLRRYAGQIRWISEPDNGMYEAINKGFDMAQGTILTYLNSDDQYYTHDTVSRVVNAFLEHPSIDFTSGHCAFMDAGGTVLYIYKAPPFNRKTALVFPRVVFHQPTCFWRRRVHIGFESSFKNCADARFFLYLCENHIGKNIKRTVAKFRLRQDSISFVNREELAKESERIFGVASKRKIPLYLRIYDLVYIRAFLNWRANLKRLILHQQKRPYV